MKTQGKVWLFYDAESKVQSRPMSVIQAQVFILSLKITDYNKFFIWTPGWDEWTCIREFVSSKQTYFVLSQPPKPDNDATALIENVPTPPENTQTQTNTGTNGEPRYTRISEPQQVLPTKEEYGYYFQDFHGNDLDLEKIKTIKPLPFKKRKTKPKPAASASSNAETTNGLDRRKDARHFLKIQVVLITKSRSFRTFSRDISLSGTQLETEIPNAFLRQSFDLIIVNPFERDPQKGRLLFKAKIIGDLSDPRRLMFIEQDAEMTRRLEALLKAYIAYQNQIRKGTGS